MVGKRSKSVCGRAGTVVLSVICMALAVVAARPARAQGTAPRMPAWLPLPADLKISDGTFLFEHYGEWRFVLDDGQGLVKVGTHWEGEYQVVGMPEITEDTDGDVAAAAIIRHVLPVLEKAGWKLLHDDHASHPRQLILQLVRGDTESWADLAVFDKGETDVDVIALHSKPRPVTLAAPAAKPEQVSGEAGDFPYLGPLPGSKFESSQPDDSPMLIAIPGQDDPEAVAPSSITKGYQSPEALSTLEFVTAYRDALTQAGWTIIEQSQDIDQTDAVLTAHYARLGRDLWAYLHDAGDEYSIEVGDAGAADLARSLAADCHAALYGLHFDFNKATLQPDSDPALEGVAALLRKQSSLTIEVQGHTDNVGSDAYNQRLSDARAGTVVNWLESHGIAASRLTAKGYGADSPIADNDSPEGRAKNRRVEIVDVNCRGK